MLIETMYTPQKQKEGKKFGNPKIIKFGKEIDVRTWINENNIDCEIYETMEKYGTMKAQKADIIAIKGDLEKLDLRNALDRKIAIENSWKSLPLEIRKEFDHDPDKFMEKGIDWANNKIKEEQEKNKINTEIKNNEQPKNNTGNEQQ